MRVAHVEMRSLLYQCAPTALTMGIFFIFCKFILFIIYMNRPRYHSQLRVFRYYIFLEVYRRRASYSCVHLFKRIESPRTLTNDVFLSLLFSRQDTLEECHTPLCNVERTNGIFSLFFRVLFSRWWWAGCQLGGRPFFGHGEKKRASLYAWRQSIKGGSIWFCVTASIITFTKKRNVDDVQEMRAAPSVSTVNRTRNEL